MAYRISFEGRTLEQEATRVGVAVANLDLDADLYRSKQFDIAAQDGTGLFSIAFDHDQGNWRVAAHRAARKALGINGDNTFGRFTSVREAINAATAAMAAAAVEG